jgi:putative PIN family toxin of toxin-antitoxin system
MSEENTDSDSVVQNVVLDTNIVLDFFLFQDPRTEPLRQQLQSGQLRWYATQHMRNELERVLTYKNIVTKLTLYQKSPADILAQFDQYAQLQEAPSAKAPYTCKDADDQVFIDLAAALAAQSQHTAIYLLSKDKAVLSMRKRLERLSIHVTEPA